MELTKDFLKNYLSKQPDPVAYEARIRESDKIRVHSDGIFSKDLAKTYQPSEPDFVIKYKEENFRPITKTFYKKVFNTIAKIERAQDFVITYPENTPGLPEADQLKPYIEDKLNLKKWLFSEFLSMYLKDPCGIVLVYPYTTEGNSFPMPVPMCIPSEKIWYKDEGLIIIRKKVVENKGKTEWILVDAEMFMYFSTNKNGVIIGEIEELPHTLGYLPCLINGGDPIYEQKGMYESIVSGVVPYWNTALVENLDLLAGIKMHVYPEKAVFAKDNCKSCNGTGSLIRDNRQIGCETCNGTGVVVTGMFGVNIMRPLKGNEIAPPDWAPVKYVEKNLNTIEFLKEHIKECLIDGLRAVNMEFLGESPENQSGVSKRYDWEQTNLFLYTIARHLCGYILPELIHIISKLRYSAILSERQIEEMQPNIQVPEKYDIIGADEIEAQIGEARKAEVDPMIIANMEKAYVAKRFSGDSFTINLMTAVIDLDPLRGRSEDDKALILASGGVDKSTYYISTNIESLVYKAYLKNSNFFNLTYDKQMEELKAIAQDEMPSQAVIGADPNITPEEGQTEQAIDIESEAKAKLKGTVGGVQGILEIQKSVAEGITQYDSAVTLLFEIYGFDNAIARQLLGDPKKIAPPQAVIPPSNGTEPAAS